MKPQSHRQLSRLLVAIASVSALSSPAFAGSATWTGTTDGTWANSANWGGVTAPGATTGTTNTDTATFTTNSHVSGITIDANRNIQNISFDLAAFSTTLGSAGANGGNALLLTSGGTLQIASTITNTGKTFTVNAPLVLEPTSSTANGTYNFANNSPGANTLNIAGSVTGGTTTGTITLNLNASAVANTNTISGSISNGGAAAVGLTVNSGTWTLSGSNSYTGATNLSGGTVNFGSATAIGSGLLTLGNGITINNTSGGALTLTSNANISIGGVTVNFKGSNNLNLGTGAVSMTSGNDTFALAGTNSVLTFAGTATNTSLGNQQTTVSGTGDTLVFGGFALGSAATASTVSFVGSGNVTLGAVADGSSIPSSLTYGGTGTMTLNGANTYSGTTTVGSGTVILSGSNSSAGATTVTGGTLLVNSAGALASGLLTLGNGVTINNTSGSPVTETNNPTVAVGNATVNFTGSNALNLGSGAVSFTAGGGETFALSGTSSVLTVGTVTNTSGASQGTTVNGSGDSFVWGGFNLGTGATAVTDTLNGSGNITINGAVANGGSVANNLTYSGTGTLALNGTNSYTGLGTFSSGTVKLNGTDTSTVGTTTLNGATLAVNNVGALAGGLFTISSGTLDNQSGTAITGQTNNPTISLGSFSFSTSAGTANNNLNLGTGAVSMSADRTITLNGAGQLTFGGTLTNTADSVRTLTVSNGTGTTSTSALNLTNVALTGTGSTLARVDLIKGSGNVNITGVVSDGTSALSGLNYSGTGTLTVSGASTFTGNMSVSSGTVAVGAAGTGTGGAVTSGPLGTGYLIMSGGTIIASGGAQTILNNIAVNNDSAGTIGGTNNLTFAGQLDLNATTTGAGSHYTTFAVTNTGLTTFSGGINLHGDQLNFTNSGNVLINSAIIGSGNFLAYSGTGTLILSGANTYTVPTDINQGTVVAGGNAPASGTGVFGNSSAGSIVLGSNSYTGAAALLANGAYTIGRNINEAYNGGTPNVAATNSSLTIGTSATGTGASAAQFTGNIALTTASTTLSAVSGGEADFTTGVISNRATFTTNPSIVIGGGGLVKLTGTNTFGGTGASVTINGGSTLNLGSAVNTASLGNASNTLIFNNGIFQFTAGTPFDLSSTRTLQFNSGGGTIDTNGDAVTFGSAIGNSGTGGGGLTLADSNTTAGSLTLSGANTYTGGTTITRGTLVAGASTSSGATNGALGNTSGTLTVNGGGLNLNANNQTVGNFTGTGGTVYSNGGTGTLTVGNGNTGGGSYAGVIKDNTTGSGQTALTKVGSGTITLTGTNTYTGATTVSSGTLAIGTAGTLGATSVALNGGSLMVGALNSTAATTIGNSSGGSLTLGGVSTTGTLSFANGLSASSAVDNFNINSSSGANALVLNNGVINIGVGATSDDIILGSGLTSSLNGSTVVNINILSALNGTRQQLISWSSAPVGVGSFSLGTTSGLSAGTYTLSLAMDSTGLYLMESSVTTAYWTGSQGSSWATGLPPNTPGTSNFTSDSTGTINRSTALDSQTSVVFTATGGTNYANTTLDGNTTINNLTFNVGGVGIGAGSGGALTIAASGNAVTVATGLGAVTETISANVVLGNSQTWTVNDATSQLVASGNISGTGSAGLNKAGSGTLTLSGVNSYTGATSVVGGALNIQSGDALDGTSGVTVNSGAALQLSGSSNFFTSNTPLTLNGSGITTHGALQNVSGNNGYLGTITLGSNATIGSHSGMLTLYNSIFANGNTLTLTGEGTGLIYGTIDSGNLVMSGTGTWTIDGLNTSTGSTTITSGTLQMGSDSYGQLGTGGIAVNGGTFDLDGVAYSVTGDLTGTGGTITNNGSVASSLTFGTGDNVTLASSIVDGTAPISIFKQGSGVTLLTGANAYSGTTAISGGALNIGNNSALGNATTATSSVTVSSGAALQIGGTTGGITTTTPVALNLSGTGVTGTPNGALENVIGNNTYSGPITISGATSIGSDAGTLTLPTTATIGGSGSLTFVGAGNGVVAGAIGSGITSLTVNSSGTWTPSNANTTGTWTLSGANTYSGPTTVSNGTLVYSAAALPSGSTINLGSSTISNSTADLTYTGSGGTIANALNLNGTQTIELGNSGTGAVVYSTAASVGAGSKTVILGNATDTFGGSIGGIANGSTGTTNLVKTGAQNSTWILTGTNSYSGTTTINGGVLQIANASLLSVGNLVLNGTVSNAVLQTQGTLNFTTGTNLNWGNNNAGFSAYGGALNLNINAGAQLTWSNNIGTAGQSTIVFGSTTSNAQVILPNAINLDSTDNYNRNIYVEKGTGGDSTLLSGLISNGTGTGAASGINKLGGGILILSNANSSYSGYTTVTSGTLVAEANSLVTVAGTSSTTTGVFGSGDGPSGTPAPATYAPIYLGTNFGNGALSTGGVVNPTVMIGGNYTVSNPINVDWNNGTGQVYGVGGYLDAASTFSGLITLSGTAATGNTFAVTQVATTGTDALNLTGGITSTNGGNVNFANVGAVNVGITGITDGSAPVSVTQSGAGTTTLAAANTYTGGTTISGGRIRLTGSTSATGTFSVGGVSGGLSTAVLSGTGTVGGALVTSSANSNVAHLSPGVNVSNNLGGAGTLTVGGALTIGTGTNLDIDLSSSTSSGNDLIAMSGGVLTIGGTVTVNFNALGTLALGSPTSNDYTLISGAGSSANLLASNFTTGTIAGTTDTAHFIVTGNNLQVYFTGISTPAAQSFSSPTPSTLRIMAGATTTVSATLANTATSGGNALNVSLADSSTGATGTVTGFSATNPTTVAAGTSSTVTGTFTAGAAGTGTWGITNTDGAATPTTASTGGSVAVFTKSTPTLSTGTASIGLVHQGATVAAQTTSLQNAAGANVAGLQVTSTGGLTNTGGQTLIAAGGSDTLSASVSTSTVGNYSQVYTVATGDDSTIVGASANANQTFTVSGQVFSGQMIWNGASGGVWGTNANWNDSQNASIHAAPGTTAGFTSTDTATFDTTGAGGTVNLASGVNPSLAAVTFNDATSYNIAPGTGGSLLLNGGGSNAQVTVTTGSHTISAPVSLTTSANLTVASGQKLTISGAVSSGNTGTGLAINGAGTTVLSSTTGNTYSGPTTITNGRVYLTNASGSATGSGAVGVGSGGVLNLAGSGANKGSISGAITLSSGGSLYSGGVLSGTPSTGAGTGAQLTSALNVNGGNLTFALSGSSYSSFASPNSTTSYISTGTQVSFTGSDSISLVDLTNGGLTLRAGSPYLLISSTLGDGGFSGLVTEDSTGHLSLDGDGYVMGVYVSGSNGSYTWNAINFNQYGSDGVTPLASNEAAPGLQLYLDAGNLEVVPEPGTWALMLGGLALLVFIQRRRNAQR